MDQPIEKTQPPARTSLEVVLMVGTWFGVTAMGFGLFSWLQDVLTRSIVLGWIQQIFG
jgi:hypothetical protein